MTPEEMILADHPLIFAVPAFVPAVIIAGVVAYISIKDRRAEAAEQAELAEHPGEDDPGSDRQED